jgi:3-oxoacyl-[acyl-carrier-protein] synthase-3
VYKLDGVSIRGVTAFVPTTVARTQDYELLSPDERARFAKGTGINARRIANADQCASDFCAFAARDLLAGLEWTTEGIGLLLLITQTGDYPVPATSIVLQDKLGLPKNCICFDVNLGCSAYPYGLAIASAMMKSMDIKRCLLLIGDISSKVCAYTDKSAWPLFGDAGSATALEVCEGDSSFYFHLMNDGSGKDAIIIPTGGLAGRSPVTSKSFQAERIDEGIERNAVNLVLKGSDIFSFAIQEVPKSIVELLTFAGIEKSAVNFFVLHQANRLITETIRTKIGATRESFLYTLSDFGNTSSASIPLTLAAHKDKFSASRTVLVSGFGVGLSWGSALINLKGDCFFSLGETDDVYPG